MDDKAVGGFHVRDRAVPSNRWDKNKSGTDMYVFLPGIRNSEKKAYGKNIRDQEFDSANSSEEKVPYCRKRKVRKWVTMIQDRTPVRSGVGLRACGEPGRATLVPGLCIQDDLPLSKVCLNMLPTGRKHMMTTQNVSLNYMNRIGL